jgi:rhamnopyranosyl-N-acetylglucosaminyl-diphospho-decaprenol beta-1,3/1,4-galactofuranosyltransferase
VRATSVTAVVVTYNRAALLAECLDAIAAQTTPPDRVVVVDNASTDDTPALLSQRTDVDAVRLVVNTGGAGGFAAGIKRALDGGCDAVWLLDDDTIPEPDALAELVRARETYPGVTPAVVASRVVWVDGRDHPMNTPRTLPGATRDDIDAAAAAGARPVRSASFVSILVDAGTAAERGLPVADYFLWNDDFEYTTRLIRGGVGLYVPSSVVVHKTRAFGSTDADPGERFYWEVRNKVWMFTRSASLTPIEKVTYGGSTLTRWIRTFIDSPDRATLRDGLRRGLADAWAGPPRPTEDVLAAAEPRA